MNSDFSFHIEKNLSGSLARTGVLQTPHGKIETPAFIFCATKGLLKGVTAQQLRECKSQVILSNTYHLEIFPGNEKINRMGGLQKLTGWNGPMLTDSGGYQIFAMGHGSVSREIKGKRNQWNPTLSKINEEGAIFRSYFDNSRKKLTPEFSIQIQRNLRADLILVLDECTPFNVSKEYTRESMERSHRWALRSIQEYQRLQLTDQALYGIIQGGTYPDLREQSIDFNNNQEQFFGIAIGGSLGSDKQTMYRTIEFMMPRIRKDKPVHLLGIGGIADIFHGIRWGIDTFDCVHPTRLARHGSALVKAKYWLEEDDSKPKESIDLNRSRFKEDMKVIDSECFCETCKCGYTRSYLNYLFRLKEPLGATLLSLHNIYFMNDLMESIRESIRNNTVDEEESKWLVDELKYQNRKSMNIACD
jgi:queuine tRNA-ribosyltransferase